MRRLTAAAAFLAALAATHPSAADFPGGGPRMSESLCRVSETALFSCRIGTKVVSICAQHQSEQAQGGAVYRFGRQGHVELEVAGLHRATDWFPGGGETQVYADTPTHRYIVYEAIVRTGFGPDGHNDPQAASGLVAQRGGTTVSNRTCTEALTFSPLAETLLPTGDYVPHDIPESALVPNPGRRPERR